MNLEAEQTIDVGTASRFATSIVIVLLVFTLALAVLSFPVGIYTVFSGGLSSQVGYGSLVGTFLWIGPIPAVLPFAVPLGGFFVVFTAVYAGLFLLALLQPLGPLRALRGAFKTGIGALMGSPFLVTFIAVGFLNFSGLIVLAVSQAVAGPVGNPFANVDPLLEFGSLSFAPLREEVGFRFVLIGLVAFVLSIGRPMRQALKSLWRPSAVYDGLVAGGVASIIIWVATGASAVTFGVCHVTCGGSNSWNLSQLPFATWAGLVLGYIYVKYGLHVAILTHWGVDYLGHVYSYFGQAVHGIPANSTTTEFFGQYLVDIDMLEFFGLASFLLVVYVATKKLTARRGQRAADAALVHKGPEEGGLVAG